MQFFEEKHCYVRNYSYICHRVSSTLRVGVRFNGSVITGANGFYPSLKSGQFQSSRIMTVCS